MQSENLQISQEVKDVVVGDDDSDDSSNNSSFNCGYFDPPI
jgi:hypothetical protein